MQRRTRSLAFATLLLASPLLSAPAAAQVGSVVEDVLFNSLDPVLAGSIAPSTRFGVAIEPLGDIDGDGTLEVAVGSGRGGPTPNGQVQILEFSSTGSLLSAVQIGDGQGGFGGALSGGDFFGGALAALGDLDGNGVPDLAVGSPFHNSGAFRSGAAWILFLNADGTVAAWQEIDTFAGGFSGVLSSDSNFGISLASLGDLNGDGVPDLAVGAPASNNSSQDQAIWILYLNADGTVQSDRRLDRFTPGLENIVGGPTSLFGYSLATLGDLDGDGDGLDLLVGDPTRLPGGGQVHSITLDPAAVVLETLTFDSAPTPGTTTNAFGSSIEPLGDLDGDGVLELAVGDTQGVATGGVEPRLQILSVTPAGSVIGTSVLDTSQGVLSNRLSQTSAFGRSIAVLGDIDGDQRIESLVGCPSESTIVTSGGGILLVDHSSGDPVADFDAEGTVGCAPWSVTFEDASSGSGLSQWAWDFGDGGTSTESDPTHVYTAPGTYTVALTVTGSSGTGRHIVYDQVRVPATPTAEFEASQTTGGVPLTVTFTDESTPGVETWSWDFGDGASSTEANPVHTYTVSGTYDVSLTVTCAGNSTTETKLDLIAVATGPDASAVEANGSGVNPFVFTSLVDPVVGTTWSGQVDGGAAGATGLVFFVGYQGAFDPGLPTAFGELLVDPATPFVELDIAILAGGLATIDLPIPNESALLGFTYAGQVLLNNVGGTGQLTNRIDYVLGT